MLWFYLHCVIAIVILIADARGTLEPTIKEWEKKLGIPVPEEQDESSTRLERDE
jgi:hypothetical protein